jgi:membrane protein DedA with SNARE-associated domain
MNLTSIIHLLIVHRYAMLLILALIEGPLVCLCAGALVHFGYFTPIPAFCLVMVGDIIPNCISYFLGKQSNKAAVTHKILRKLKITPRHLEILEKVWVTHTHKTMFLAKLAWGLGVPLFMSAGMTTLSFKKFLGSMTMIALFQYAIVMFLGYSLARSYSLISQSNSVIETIGIVVSVLIFGIILFSISKYARGKILEEK